MQYKLKGKARMYLPVETEVVKEALYHDENDNYVSGRSYHVIARDEAVKHVADHLRAIGDEINAEFSIESNVWLRLYRILTKRRHSI